MLHLPCLFRAMTGLYCPGCGGTRAVQYLLQGRLLLSLRYHPLVLYALLAVAESHKLCAGKGMGRPPALCGT